MSIDGVGHLLCELGWTKSCVKISPYRDHGLFRITVLIECQGLALSEFQWFPVYSSEIVAFTYSDDGNLLTNFVHLNLTHTQILCTSM